HCSARGTARRASRPVGWNSSAPRGECRLWRNDSYKPQAVRHKAYGLDLRLAGLGCLCVSSDSVHHVLVHERDRHPAGSAPPPPVEPHGAPAVAPLPAALADRAWAAEQAGQLLLGAVDQRNTTLVAEARRVEECDYVRVPLDEMRTEVEPRSVVRAADYHPALHDLRRAWGGLAAHDVRVREGAGPLQERPIADARREAAVHRTGGWGPGGGGGGGSRRLGDGAGGDQRREQERPADRTHDPIYRPENENGPGCPGPLRLTTALLRPCGRSAPASPSDPGRLRIRPYRPRRDCGSPQPGSP